MKNKGKPEKKRQQPRVRAPDEKADRAADARREPRERRQRENDEKVFRRKIFHDCPMPKNVPAIFRAFPEE